MSFLPNMLKNKGTDSIHYFVININFVSLIKMVNIFIFPTKSDMSNPEAVICKFMNCCGSFSVLAEVTPTGTVILFCQIQ